VRDSKHREGPVLIFGTAQWQSFLSKMKTEERGL
jgi:hypothetical protein